MISPMAFDSIRNGRTFFFTRILLVLTGVCWWIRSLADEPRLGVRAEKQNLILHVESGSNQEFRFQTSSNLVAWTNTPALGTIYNLGTNTSTRSVAATNGQRFIRGIKTRGMFDTNVFRTISLTFTQSNWQTLLANARASSTSIPGTVVLDNGAVITNAGMRYKGNTSYTMGGTKKSVNIQLDYGNTNADLMGFKTINLNNAAGDETIMREPVYFNVMQTYAPSPKGSMARLIINGEYWGVYSLAQQENSDLVKEWFPSHDGDRWRAPNVGGTAGTGTSGGGGFASAGSALSYLTSLSYYKSNYELKTDNSTNAWEHLMHVCDVLNNTPAAQLRDKVDEVLAVDRWLWFLAIENIFADDDSYFNKGADYVLYYEPESGRIHPIEHDGNEAFTAGDVQLSPVYGATLTNRPVLYKLLPINEYRQRYLAHMRTVLEERYHPSIMTPQIDYFNALTIADIIADTKKNFTMTAYTNDLVALKTFVTNRYNYLTTHSELKPLQPRIESVMPPVTAPSATDIPSITAKVLANGSDGIDSVWLYYRIQPYGRFTVVQMFDDGLHGDGAAGDNVFGAATTNFPAGTKVRYYVEARSANAAKAAAFSPARAEQETYNYRVALTLATNTPVVINEVMASNSTTIADPQGDFDDWIELRNITDAPVDLSGHYLSDEPNNPRKWQFPAGTIISADGFLVVWADEDGKATEGLHASFKLSASGEQLFLTDTDARLNAVLDTVTFGPQTTDKSYGRSSSDADVWEIMIPSPGKSN